MKITNVEARWIRVPIPQARQHTSDFGRADTFDTAIVRIDTDEGLSGWGEAKNAAGSAGSYGALATLVNQEMAPLLRGEDPLRINRLYEVLYSGTRAHLALERGHVFPVMARRGLSIAALSGIDLALWDILGKSLGVPVHQLLGGKRVDRMPAYASGGWAPAADIGAQLRGYIEAGGFRAVKMRVGVQDGSPWRSAERVIAAREAIGPDVDLMCDAHGTLTVSEAKEFCHLVRDCRLAWFEEPVTADDPRGLAQVRRSTHVPIAAGESEYTRFDFRTLIETEAVDILQPDLAICGGISEAVRIAALASAANLRLAPHLWAGAPAFAAGLHVAAASNCGFIIEYSLGANPMIHELVEESFPVRDGYIEIPDRPGLGITPDLDFVDRHTVTGPATA
ncbi:MAG: mandelate racemase/muconate lactonizing enzyme family protein [Burkholderiaceae bacterium]|nr:mandelate racemase/muconate lactonizing enzyme family protein [Burkholderiaceae bacterium]